jgi:hypothetical protein
VVIQVKQKYSELKIKKLKMKKFIFVLFAFIMALSSCGKKEDTNKVMEDKSTNKADATKTIAKNAYIYAYPMVQMYGIIYKYNIDEKNPEYKGPFNKIVNVPRVFTPADKAIVTPNSDTPYSFLTMDLRAEPIVISVPEIPKDRYYSVMLLDLYTYIYDVIGSRSTGNEAGKFLIAGPDWKGELPAGIKKIIRCDTQFSFACFRTQLFNPADLKNVIKIQDQYGAEPLSSYLKTAPPPAPPKIEWPAFDAKVADREGMLSYLNFLLQFCPVVPSETKLRSDFEKIGIIPGKPFNENSKDSKEISEGYTEAMTSMKESAEKDLKDKVSSGKFFGSMQYLGDNYMNRAIGAKLGIGGLIGQEAEYFPYRTSADGQPINTAANNYEVTFKAGQFPPVNAFWSFTMYDEKTQLLIENPINRYIINSPMLPELKLNKDSSLTIYIQKDSPGAAKQSNWLPAPNGDAYVVLRCYWPKEAILNGTWKEPEIVKVN